MRTGPRWRVRTPARPGPRTQGPSLCPRRLLGATGGIPAKEAALAAGRGEGACPVSREHEQGQPGQPLMGAPRQGWEARALTRPAPGPDPWPSRGSWLLDDLLCSMWLAASEPLPSGPVSRQSWRPGDTPPGKAGRGGHLWALVSEEGAALASAWASAELMAVASRLLAWARHLPSADPPLVLRAWGGLAPETKQLEAVSPCCLLSRLCAV